VSYPARPVRAACSIISEHWRSRLLAVRSDPSPSWRALLQTQLRNIFTSALGKYYRADIPALHDYTTPRAHCLLLCHQHAPDA